MFFSFVRMGKAKSKAVPPEPRPGTDVASLSQLAKAIREQKAAAEGSESTTRPGEQKAPAVDPPAEVPVVKRRKTGKTPNEDGQREPAPSSGSKKAEKVKDAEKNEKKKEKVNEKNEKEKQKERSKEKNEKPVEKEKAPRSAAKAVKDVLKRGKTQEITPEDLLAADGFNPTALPFVLSWQNYDKLKNFYQLQDDECTTILLAMVGPCESGRQFWSRFKVPLEMFDEKNVLKTPQNSEMQKPVDKNAQNEMQKPFDTNAQNLEELPPVHEGKGKKRLPDDTESTCTTEALNAQKEDEEKPKRPRKVQNPDELDDSAEDPEGEESEGIISDSSDEPPPRQVPRQPTEQDVAVETPPVTYLWIHYGSFICMWSVFCSLFLSCAFRNHVHEFLVHEKCFASLRHRRPLPSVHIVPSTLIHLDSQCFVFASMIWDLAELSIFLAWPFLRCARGLWKLWIWHRQN